MWALLPLKRCDYAKERLAGVLTPAERHTLCRVMATDLLAVLCGHPLLDGVVVVSGDAAVKTLVDDFSIELLEESSLDAVGLNAVVQASVAEMSRRGIDDVMVIHGDLPMISASEITGLVTAHAALGASAITLAPDRRGTGTNGILCSRRPHFRFEFGVGSFQKHYAQLLADTAPFQVARYRGTESDIDYPEDLKHLLEHSAPQTATHTRRYLIESGIASRLRHLDSVDIVARDSAAKNSQPFHLAS